MMHIKILGVECSRLPHVKRMMCCLVVLICVRYGSSCIFVSGKYSHGIVQLTVLDSANIAVDGDVLPLSDVSQILRNEIRKGPRVPSLLLVAAPHIPHSEIRDVMHVAMYEGYFSFILSTNASDIAHSIIEGERKQFTYVPPHDAFNNDKARTNDNVVRLHVHNSAYFIDGIKYSREEYEEILKQIVKRYPETVLRIYCDRGLTHGDLVRVLDMCMKLGFQPPQLVDLLVFIRL